MRHAKDTAYALLCSPPQRPEGTSLFNKGGGQGVRFWLSCNNALTASEGGCVNHVRIGWSTQSLLAALLDWGSPLKRSPLQGKTPQRGRTNPAELTAEKGC